MIPGEEPTDKYAETLKELLCVHPVPSHSNIQSHFFRPAVFKMGLLFPLLPRASRIGSAAFRRFIVNLIPSKNLRKARDLVNSMETTATKLVLGKKEAVRRGQLEMDPDSKDVMSLLCALPIRAYLLGTDHFQCEEIYWPMRR
jgi:hypothetical protein